MLKYPDETKLMYIGTDRSNFENGKVYVVFKDGIFSSSYRIPQIKHLPNGWNSTFIEDLEQFKQLPNWQERIERLSKLEGTK